MKKKKRLILDVSDEDHSEIKIRAARIGISLRLWVMRAIAEKIKRENERENIDEKSN